MTPKLDRQIEESIETDIDFWQEQKHELCELCGKRINSEYHMGKSCVTSRAEEAEQIDFLIESQED
jgi:hypothetical protein